VRVLVVDDEAAARRRLVRLLRRQPDVTHVETAGTGPDAIAVIKARRPDLLFLDVQMPGTDGFGVLAALTPEQTPATVFVTAFDEHAVRAFQVNAVDFLLKPFDDERFRATLDRVRARGQAGADLAAVVRALKMPQPDRLAIKVDGRILVHDVSSIVWIEAEGKYVRVHLASASHLIRQPIGALEERFRAAGFVRTHRSVLVNLRFVRELHEMFNGEYEVLLATGGRLPVSRRMRPELSAALGGGI
jgi:two-component system LytT family response regulator